MGMFDTIRYQGDEYQTKDTPAQGLDNYKIEQNLEDGHWYLWYEEYEAEWIEEEEGRFFGGYLNRSNERWELCNDFDGSIRFYRSERNEDTGKRDIWIEYKALFMNGQMIKITRIEE